MYQQMPILPPPEEKGFFSKMASALNPFNWDIKGWLKAGAAALGLGVLAHKSDAVRETIDNVFSPVTDTAVGTWAANNVGHPFLNLFSGKNITETSVAGRKTIGNLTFLVPDESLKMDTSGEDLQKLRDMRKAINGTYAASLTYIEEDQSRYKINKDLGVVLEHGRKYEVWNKVVDNYEKEFGDLIASGAVHKPPKFDLNTPEIPDSLKIYADVKKIPAFEQMSPITQIIALRDALIKDTESAPSFKAAHLRGENLFDLGSSIAFALPGSEWFAKQAKGKLTKEGMESARLSDEGIEFAGQVNIKEAIKEGNYAEAAKMAKEVEQYFRSVKEGFGNNSDKKDEAAQYKKAEEHFGKLAAYAINLERKERLGEILDKTVGGILDGTQHAKNSLNAYNESVENIEIARGIKERKIENKVNGHDHSNDNKEPTPQNQPSRDEHKDHEVKGKDTITPESHDVVDAAKAESTAMQKARAQVGSILPTDDVGNIVKDHINSAISGFPPIMVKARREANSTTPTP